MGVSLLRIAVGHSDRVACYSSQHHHLVNAKRNVSLCAATSAASGPPKIPLKGRPSTMPFLSGLKIAQNPNFLGISDGLLTEAVTFSGH